MSDFKKEEITEFDTVKAKANVYEMLASTVLDDVLCNDILCHFAAGPSYDKDGMIEIKEFLIGLTDSMVMYHNDSVFHLEKEIKELIEINKDCIKLIRSHYEILNICQKYENPKPESNKVMEEDNFSYENNKATTMSGFLYIASHSQNEDLYKIGRSSNLNIREKTLKTGNVTLKIIASRKTLDPVRDESLFHGIFKKRRVDGEWFSLTKEEINFIVKHLDFNYQLQ